MAQPTIAVFLDGEPRLITIDALRELLGPAPTRHDDGGLAAVVEVVNATSRDVRGDVGRAFEQIGVTQIRTDALEDERDRLDGLVAGLLQDGTAAEAAVAALAKVAVDGQAVQRQLARDAGRLSEAALQVLLLANDTSARLRDAGIYVDQTTGVVHIYAIDELGTRANRVDIQLDAQAAAIGLRATSIEVDEKILRAVLSPEQVAQLEPLLARLALAEVAIDGLRGEVRTKAEVAELAKAVVRLTTAEQRISAAEGSIESKVEQSEFDALYADVGSAKQLLQSFGDVSRYAVDLRQARADNREAGAGLLGQVVAGWEAGERHVLAQAELHQELTTTITAGLGAEARARQTLATSLGELDARQIQDRRSLVEAKLALSESIDALGAENERQGAAIGELRRASVDAVGGIAAVEMTIRQRTRGDASDGAALLGQVVAGAAASDRVTEALAEIHSQLTTTLIAGFSASAVAREQLAARIGASDARFAAERAATADRLGAVTSLIEALRADFDDPGDGLAATRAEIADLAEATANATGAVSERLATLRASVLDPSTGLAITRAELAALAQASADADEARAAEIEQLVARLDDPATGLARTRVELATLKDGTAAADNARAIEIGQLAVELHDPDTGLPATRARVAAERSASIDRDNLAAQAITTVEGRLDDQAADVSELRDVVIGPGGATARAVLRVVSGGKIIGTVATNDGEIGSFTIAADVFEVVDPDTGEVLLAVNQDRTLAAQIANGSAARTHVFTTGADIVVAYTA